MEQRENDLDSGLGDSKDGGLRKRKKTNFSHSSVGSEDSSSYRPSPLDLKRDLVRKNMGRQLRCNTDVAGIELKQA